MEIPNEIHISEIKMTIMKEIDLTNDIRYSAIINGNKIMMQTDGMFKKHLSIDQWLQYVLMAYIERYNQLHEANK